MAHPAFLRMLRPLLCLKHKHIQNTFSFACFFQVVDQQLDAIQANGWGYKARLMPAVKKELQFASGK